MYQSGGFFGVFAILLLLEDHSDPLDVLADVEDSQERLRQLLARNERVVHDVNRARGEARVQDALTAVSLGAVTRLVAPRPHGGVDAGAGDEEERERVPARDAADEPPAEVDDEERDRAVEDPLLARRPRRDLSAAEVAPEEVRHNRDRDEERNAQQHRRGHERLLLVQHDDRERDDPQNRQVPDQRADVHEAVIQARTASAAATIVATENQSSRVRGSSGAYSHGERTASSAKA